MKTLINILPSPWNIVAMIATVALLIFIAWILTFINKKVFAKIQKNNTGIHLIFFEKLNAVIIWAACIILSLSAVNGLSSIWKTILGGTAIVRAVLAYAAQDVIKDIIAGLMISIHKPFEIGDRIVLEDGTAGIVENITMRHIVLRGIDTLRLIIPNSRLNGMKMTNYSVGDFGRSVHFNFSIGYDSDVDLARKVIFEAVKESEYSIPVRTPESEEISYPPVYFYSFEVSARIMAVTVYYEKTFKTERVIDDINTRVREALLANGIEIPYKYVTVVSKDKSKND